MNGTISFVHLVECELLKFFQNSCEYKICFKAFPFLTDIHKVFVFQIGILLALVTLVLFKKNIRGIILWGVFWIAVGDGMGGVIKKWIDRPRPMEAGLLIDERCPQAGGGSMPSNHSLNSFAIWSFFKPVMDRWHPILFVVATVGAYLRVWCGVHYPGDVLVGALLGTLWGLLGWHLRRKFLLLVERVF